MNKKTLIQLIIIIGAFAGAGMVLYNGLYKDTGTSAETELQNAVASQQTVLPYGGSLDFNVLKKQNLFYNQATYPKIDPNSDYGIQLNNLIVIPYTE